ncbi:MAG: hypothetical protein IPO67_23665 [Deltaproteobacteria bacterium]|nr:hypothetical protein [Deltaproteobacteria bacterium]
MRRLRVVCYAINGRGLGHLTRQLAIARWMRRYAEVLDVGLELWVLTSSEADTLARREGFPALKLPSKAMLRDAGVDLSRGLTIARAWVMQSVALLQPDLLIVDTFPGGTYGELLATLELAPKRALVARPVRANMAEDPGYSGLLPLYQTVLVPDDAGATVSSEPGGLGPILLREREELLPRDAARRALGVPEGQRAVWLSLGGGGDPAAMSTLPRLVDALRGRGWHVVVAAGPLYDGVERRGEGVTWLDRYASMELLCGVDAAVSAGGYNAFHELMFAGVPTVFLPQPRVADDQEARVARAVAVGAARLARTLEDVPALLESPGDAAAARALVPRNGARDAAARLLSTLLPADDVARAAELLSPALLGSRSAQGMAPRQLLELARALSGDSPSQHAARRAGALDWIDRGLLHGEIPKDPPPAAPLLSLLGRFDTIGLPPERGAELVLGLRRRWPAATPMELYSAADTLLTAFVPFEDWGGAVALLRAMPSQRTWALASFADALSRWLTHERDLFDAQRSFVKVEGGGKRGLAESLALLADGGAATGHSAADDEPLL